MLLMPAAHGPTIADQPEVVQHYHTFVMRCPCPAKTISVIVGEGRGVACPSCGGTPIATIQQAKIAIDFDRPTKLFGIN